jgi:hypothetical protein
MRLFFSMVLALALWAQPREEMWPGAKYDPGIPTYQKVLGYEPGERITSHAGLMKYAEALAAAAPARVKVFEYAQSWEGRKLICVVVGSEANIRRLKEIQAAMKRLADPRVTGEAEAKRLMSSLPATVWIAAGVHGNEISSPEAALLAAYHLLASRGDRMVDEILANALVFFVPTQNPDGRDRFVHHYEQSYGLEPDPSPVALEHAEPFPGGRPNHYQFDINRDWVALTQPEIRGQVKALLEWLPLVCVDLHEMGADTTYYFAPPAAPYNPHLVKDQKDSLYEIGKNNAKWFDQFGFSYFTREVFDAFYPGYGDAWPAYYGAVAATYEQASARGLVMRRLDETLLPFRETIRHHFVASLSTCEAAAKNRVKLLENFYRYRQTAIEEGQKEPVKEYVLVRKGDVSAVDKLALLLAEHGVEVKRAAAAFKAGGKEVPAGSYAVPMAQPAKRRIRTLLDPNVPMTDEFLKEQERRRKMKLPDEIYDVTGWSLPLMFNVETIANPEVSSGGFEMVKAGSPLPGKVIGGKATVAYLVPWGNAAAGRFLTAALREGLKVDTSDKEFTQGARKYPRGTLIVRVMANPSDVAEKVSRLAVASGAEVYATDTSWVEDGVNFGSRYVYPVRKPVIALAWDRPVSSSSAGHARFVLERQFGYPVTPVRVSSFAMADLSKFQVIILPDGPGEGYTSALGVAGARRLRDWVAAGGRLVAIGSANSFLADPRNGLLAISPENLAREGQPAQPAKRPETPSATPGAAAGAAAGTAAAAVTGAGPAETRVAGKLIGSEADYQKAIQADTEPPDTLSGVLLRARTDREHWVTAGVAETVNALVEGRNIYTPIKLDKGVNAAVFAPPDEILAGGYVWAENKAQLAFKPLIVVQREGRGSIVGFTADPNYRAYLDGMNVAFLNAVFRGAAMSQRPAGED